MASSLISIFAKLFGIIVIITLSPALLLVGLVWLLFALLVLLWIHITWLPRGKDTLIVYSNSPYWQSYFEDGLIPVLGSRAKVLNHSQRSKWNSASPSVWAFKILGGSREYNPLVVVFKPFQWPQCFRFYKAFRDQKHGKRTKLLELESQLSNCIRKRIAFPEH